MKTEIQYFPKSIKVYKGTEYINTGDLNIPYGWEVAEAGDMPIKDGAVTVVVREKEYTKDVSCKLCR